MKVKYRGKTYKIQEIELGGHWDVDKNGFEVFCPNCGARMDKEQ